MKIKIGNKYLTKNNKVVLITRKNTYPSPHRYWQGAVLDKNDQEAYSIGLSKTGLYYVRGLRGFSLDLVKRLPNFHYNLED